MNEAPSRGDEAQSLRLLVEQAYSLTGYDFRDYALDHLRRRARAMAEAEGVPGIEGLRSKVLAEPQALGRFVEALAARESSFCGEPALYRSLRRAALPLLRTFPSIRIWHVGCGSGEDSYALAALLREEGLLARSRIYATDVSPSAIRTARGAEYPLETLRGAAARWAEAGGVSRPTDHAAVEGPLVRFSAELRSRLVFSEHSPATDSTFNEFHLIVCRDLLDQFNRALQKRAYALMDQSLCPFGLLAARAAAALPESALGLRLETLDQPNGLYRKVR